MNQSEHDDENDSPSALFLSGRSHPPHQPPLSPPAILSHFDGFVKTFIRRDFRVEFPWFGRPYQRLSHSNWLVWQKHAKLLHFPYNFFCILCHFHLSVWSSMAKYQTISKKNAWKRNESSSRPKPKKWYWGIDGNATGATERDFHKRISERWRERGNNERKIETRSENAV